MPTRANFVRQDLRKGKHQMASAGASKNAKQFRRSHGKRSGRAPYMSWKAKRAKHFQDQALATTSLLEVSGAEKVETFSPAVTRELLSALREQDESGEQLGELRTERPPDERAASEPAAAERPPPQRAVDAPAEEGAAAAEAADAAEAAADRPSDGEAVEGPDQLREDPAEYTAEDLQEILRRRFGHKNFRPGQQEAMMSVLQGKSTLLLLSTGSGKSLCYQMPAYLLREEGLTLVVSPLVSLMADQLMRLPNCLRGAVVSGQQSREQTRTVMRAVRGRLVDVLFISPERLSMWALDGCGLPPIALACIDEAHCVSEWSHNFRPDYLRLREFLTGALNARRLLALTATATRPTIQSVCDILRIDTIVRVDRAFTLAELLQEPAQPRVQRSNLSMDVRCVADEDVQFGELLKLLRDEENARSPTVVYVWKRFTADQWAKRLRQLVRGGVRSYHGSMLPEDRRQTQDAFMSGITRVVVATMAFGMGLDKPDIRMVIHAGLPKSIENYIQETGRCSRDGEPGKCVTLVTPKDYKTMRWVESGGKGAGNQTGTVQKVMNMIFSAEHKGLQQRYEVCCPEGAEADSDVGADGSTPDGWRGCLVAFEESDVATELHCQTDELHSILAHLAFRAKGYVKLVSKFPTKLKLRFFKTDPVQLAQEDPLLRMVMPFAKRHGPVHTLETAKVLSHIGGCAGRLTTALFEGKGDEFSVEKAAYGYMVQVLRPVGPARVAAWASEISDINRQNQINCVEKLDAAFIALKRASDARRSVEQEPAADDGGEALRRPGPDEVLNELIDAYFAATSDPSKVVAGSDEERRRTLYGALGEQYGASTRRFTAAPAQQSSGQPPAAGAGGAGAPEVDEEREQREQLEQAAVYSVVARLVMSQEWTALPLGGDHASVAHVATQVLAGIGSQMLPAKKWKDHRCWGRFRGMAEFRYLEELVTESLKKLHSLRAGKPQEPQPRAA